MVEKAAGRRKGGNSLNSVSGQIQGKLSSTKMRTKYRPEKEGGGDGKRGGGRQGCLNDPQVGGGWPSLVKMAAGSGK